MYQLKTNKDKIHISQKPNDKKLTKKHYLNYNLCWYIEQEITQIPV